jgi:hypothetical protein
VPHICSRGPSLLDGLGNSGMSTPACEWGIDRSDAGGPPRPRWIPAWDVDCPASYFPDHMPSMRKEGTGCRLRRLRRMCPPPPSRARAICSPP